MQEVGTGRNEEAETESEAMGECCFLACPPWLAQFAVFYTLGPPAQRWHCQRWTGHVLINHQSGKHCTTQSDEGILSAKFSLRDDSSGPVTTTKPKILGQGT